MAHLPRAGIVSRALVSAGSQKGRVTGKERGEEAGHIKRQLQSPRPLPASENQEPCDTKVDLLSPAPENTCQATGERSHANRISREKHSDW